MRRPPSAFATYLPASILAAVLLAALASGCGGSASTPPLFERLDPSATGVTFENTLAEGADFNILSYPYYYNGGGVAVGDIDGDDRPDLFFTANEQENQLYLNRTEPGGPIRFEAATETAGVGGLGNWSTGVTMADVNADGRLDLYVMNVGGYLDRAGRNELFINEGPGEDGIPRFSEQADRFGLDFEGYATHAAFFDYDRDGDLDVYLLNHSTHTERTYRRAEQVRVRHERAGDRLLRNDATPSGPRFVEVSQEAGIQSGAAGYGLSIAVADFDDDGWPDLYVGNDFHENDLLYINDGPDETGTVTFREVIQTAMSHTSTFSMGADAADIDNDGRIDLAVLDMLPGREDIRKTSDDGDTYALYELKRRLGYHHQLARNSLQLNRGVAADGTPRFSDIAPLAGVSATDWSWAALFADLDLDGHRDLFITNGIYRRPNDLDYINYVSSEVAQATLSQGGAESDLALLERMPQVPIPNAAFRNAGGLQFEDAADAWGLAEPGFSNGAAYADLDGDGDLDLVLNNVNAPASIYANQAADRAAQQGTHHFLTLAFEGAAANPFGTGTRVTVVTDGQRQVAEQMPSRGFQSSVEPRVHLGLGSAAVVDTLAVRWPDGRVQTLAGVTANQVLTLRYAEAAPPPSTSAAFTTPLFDVADTMAVPFRHDENDFVDFNREKLMPHKRSTDGPAMAVGDVDGDGLDDVYLGGAKQQAGALLLQRPDGSFAQADIPAFQADSLAEDVDAALFDADGDGDLDLIVASGGNEFWDDAEALLDRFYRNEGGTLVRDRDALPPTYGNAATLVPGDVDGDGDLDLFVGARTTPREYGVVPPSFLLENDGTGRFRDVTAERAPSLAVAGLLADAAWADTDGDGDLDLLLAGEWMPLTVYVNNGGTLAPADAGLGATSGWWHSIATADLDGDGDLDFVAGNLGRNSVLQTDADAPAKLFVGDLDGDGSSESLLTTFRDGADYPYASVDLLQSKFPALRREYPDFASYGARTVSELFSNAALASADVLDATTFASVWGENDGTGRFTVHALPIEAQFAPTFALLPGDFDRDGVTDVLLAGNFTGVRPDRGKEDAGYGLLLRGTAGTGTDRFEAVDLARSGVVLPGEVRKLSTFANPAGVALILAARNDARPLVLRPTARTEETRGDDALAAR